MRLQFGDISFFRRSERPPKTFGDIAQMDMEYPGWFCSTRLQIAQRIFVSAYYWISSDWWFNTYEQYSWVSRLIRFELWCTPMDIAYRTARRLVYDSSQLRKPHSHHPHQILCRLGSQLQQIVYSLHLGIIYIDTFINQIVVSILIPVYV